MDKLSQNKQCEKAEKNIYVKINEMVRSNLLKFIAGKNIPYCTAIRTMQGWELIEL